MALVYLGLGSNLGEKDKNLRTAVSRLEDSGWIEVIDQSSVLETVPVDYTRQPDFLNQVVKIRTSMGPHGLLDEVKKIEEDMGRVKGAPKGPRVIDIDILIFDDVVINSENLTIPHPEIENRNFVLRHLLELDPELENPVTKLKYREAREG